MKLTLKLHNLKKLPQISNSKRELHFKEGLHFRERGLASEKASFRRDGASEREIKCRRKRLGFSSSRLEDRNERGLTGFCIMILP